MSWEIDPKLYQPIPIDNTDPWHKFLGDTRDPGRHEIRDHVLCFKYRNENPTTGSWLNVTVLNEFVTCQECIELIRS